MRELEFLPEWYPEIRRKRRMVFMQGWLTILAVATVGVWLFLAQRNVRDKQGQLLTLKSQITQTQSDLDRLDQMEQLRRKWQHQDQIIEKLGKHIESSRLITAMDELMPANMALVSLDVANQEQTVTPGSLASMRPEEAKKPPARKIKVRVQGLAPNDEDLANFLAKLTSHPFEQVALTYSRQRSDNGHVMREFEVAFAVDLAAVGGE